MAKVTFNVQDWIARRDEVACEVGGVDPEGHRVEVVLAVLEKNRWKAVDRRIVSESGLIRWGPVLVPGRKYRFSAAVRGLAAGESQIFTSGKVDNPVAVDLMRTGALSVRILRESPIRRVFVEDMNGTLVLGQWKTLKPQQNNLREPYSILGWRGVLSI